MGEKIYFEGLFSKNGKVCFFKGGFQTGCGKLCGNCVKLLDLHGFAAFFEGAISCAKPKGRVREKRRQSAGCLKGLFQSAKSGRGPKVNACSAPPFGLVAVFLAALHFCAQKNKNLPNFSRMS